MKTLESFPHFRMAGNRIKTPSPVTAGLLFIRMGLTMIALHLIWWIWSRLVTGYDVARTSRRFRRTERWLVWVWTGSLTYDRWLAWTTWVFTIASGLAIGLFWYMVCFVLL